MSATPRMGEITMRASAQTEPKMDGDSEAHGRDRKIGTNDKRLTSAVKDYDHERSQTAD
jgi:hypothetical protein